MYQATGAAEMRARRVGREMERLKADYDGVRGDLTGTRSDNVDMRDAIEGFNIEVRDLKYQLNSRKIKLEQTLEELGTASNSVEQLTHAAKGHEQWGKARENDLKDLKAKHEATKGELTRAQSTLAKKECEFERALTQHTATRQELTNAQSTLAKKECELETSLTQHAAIQQELTNAQSTLAKTECELERSHNEYAATKGRLSSDHSRVTSELQLDRDQLSSMRVDIQTRDAVIKRSLKEIRTLRTKAVVAQSTNNQINRVLKKRTEEYVSLEARHNDTKNQPLASQDITQKTRLDLSHANGKFDDYERMTNNEIDALEDMIVWLKSSIQRLMNEHARKERKLDNHIDNLTASISGLVASLEDVETTRMEQELYYEEQLQYMEEDHVLEQMDLQQVTALANEYMETQQLQQMEML